MILYRSLVCTLYHLVVVVGGWLLKRLKFSKKLGGFQGSAIILVMRNRKCPLELSGESFEREQA